jgi:hypothetical protein
VKIPSPFIENFPFNKLFEEWLSGFYTLVKYN